MRRRDFLALAGAAAVAPRVAWGEQAKVPRIAWLSLPLNPVSIEAFKQGLAEQGFVDGQNVVIDVFTAPTNADMPAYASRVVSTKPDIIVPWGTPPTSALKAMATTIPVVFVTVNDPVVSGIVESLAHTGSNITGLSNTSPHLIPRQVGLLKEIVPTLTRFSVPFFHDAFVDVTYLPPLQAASRALQIEPVLVDLVEGGGDYASQLERAFSPDIQGVLQLAFTQFNTSFDLLYDVYLRAKIPVVHGGLLQDGAPTPFSGVVQYGPDNLSMIRTRGAAMVAAILNGAKAADLPVELPTIFDLSVNLDMAKKIEVTIPPDILAQATLVIDYDLRAPKAAAK